MGKSDTHKSDNKAKYNKDWGAVGQIHDHSIDVEKRELYLFPRDEYISGSGAVDDGPATEPGVEFGMSNQFIKNLRILMSISEEPILVHMKTCGGYWEEGISMYQAIRACPNHITILNYASARSMSSLIFLAADRRVMMPLSSFMMHRGDNVIAGTGTQVDTQYRETMKADKQMISIYVEALRESRPMQGWSDKKIEQWIHKKMKEHEDVHFTAEEAVEYNLADMIFGADGNYDWAALRKE